VAMVALLALLFPAVLLALALAMERVEAPLREEAIGDQVARFLESARPDEVETFVRDGLARPIARYWRSSPSAPRRGLVMRMRSLTGRS
jgi:hypothetical protein